MFSDNIRTSDIGFYLFFFQHLSFKKHTYISRLKIVLVINFLLRKICCAVKETMLFLDHSTLSLKQQLALNFCFVFFLFQAPPDVPWVSSDKKTTVTHREDTCNTGEAKLFEQTYSTMDMTRLKHGIFVSFMFCFITKLHLG